MGPKRAAKKKSEASEDGEVATKRAKVEAASPDCRWEYEADKRTWTQYSDALNQCIQGAFDANKKQVDFELSNGVKMAVNFEKMVQKNKKTGWERPVRLAVKDPADAAFYVWQWEDEKGRLNAYSGRHCLELESARDSKTPTITIDASARAYEISLTDMEQRNTVTDVCRKVMRDKSGAIKPDPEAPKPVAVSTSAGSSKGGRGAKSGAKSGGKSGGKVKVEDPEEEDEEVGSKAAKSGSKGRAKSGPVERPAVKTIVLSGKAPVDPECTAMVNKAHVYYEGANVWDCMLNQTSVDNNNNKYFIIQLLEMNEAKHYKVWFRWGRVGYKGMNNLVPCGGDLNAAKKAFTKKFSDKTKNDWATRKNFKKTPGKYDLLEMDYSAKDTDEVDAPDLKKKSSGRKMPDSKLDKRLQSLIELICDVKSMEEAVIEMQYDAKKAPLGKLTTDQIKAGYSALKKIDALIEKKDFGSALTQACDEFYTRIPHDFGMRPPSKIKTKQQVKTKIELLEALGDIQIAIKMLKEGDMTENPTDRHYHSLKCDLAPYDHKHDEFKMVETYLHNTHATTHNQYKMQLLDIYDIGKHGEDAKFNDCGNRMLLWHGSRLTNWVGILSQGLRIAPPEAPVTGYMFGKGVYFADMSSKSANYCFATRTKKIGLLLLCDVALGSWNTLLSADYGAAKLPPGKHSVLGAGSIAPDPAHVHKTPDGVSVPWGKGTTSGVKNPTGYTLNYNEFIVYNTNQIRMKYLLKVQFNFK